MSRLQEIERAVEGLPLQDFLKFGAWIDQRRQELAGGRVHYRRVITARS